ncbi:MAG TPA: hypothetical protein VGR68_01790 [Actinomycetota bacterium]|nr:hypothetical protein [Actinomycetota bacterium]
MLEVDHHDVEADQAEGLDGDRVRLVDPGPPERPSAGEELLERASVARPARPGRRGAGLQLRQGLRPYRLGVHDGLRFAEDALLDPLRRHGHQVDPSPSRQADA